MSAPASGLNTLTAADFRELEAPLLVEVGADSSAAMFELAIESVVTLPPHRLRAAPFSLVLRGPRTPLLTQATYRVRHPSLGTLELFLVPIGQDAAGTRYQVVFN